MGNNENEWEEKRLIPVCMVCESAYIGGRLVPAGEYSFTEELANHGFRSRACYRLACDADFGSSDIERCPKPARKIGRILYAPDGKTFLSEGFFEIVAPGYEVITLNRDFIIGDISEAIEVLEVDLVIPNGFADFFHDMACPVIHEYSDKCQLIGKIRKGLVDSRARHYEKHFG